MLNCSICYIDYFNILAEFLDLLCIFLLLIFGLEMWYIIVYNWLRFIWIFLSTYCQLLCIYFLNGLIEIFAYLERYGWINFRIRHAVANVYPYGLLPCLSWFFFKGVLLLIFPCYILVFSFASETKIFLVFVWLLLSLPMATLCFLCYLNVPISLVVIWLFTHVKNIVAY